MKKKKKKNFGLLSTRISGPKNGVFFVAFCF